MSRIGQRIVNPGIEGNFLKGVPYQENSIIRFYYVL